MVDYGVGGSSGAAGNAIERVVQMFMVSSIPRKV